MSEAQKETAMLQAPQMVLIGAGGQNSGKTTLACGIIKEWKSRVPVYAAKVIAIDCANGKCHRGQQGCGICTSLRGDYELLPEKNPTGQKDTALMLAAGAQQVFLLKSLKSSLPQAAQQLLSRLPKNALLVCESNSLRKHVQPGVFVMMDDGLSCKPSAKEVAACADVTLRLGDGAEGLLQAEKQPDGSLKVRLALQPKTQSKQG